MMIDLLVLLVRLSTDSTRVFEPNCAMARDDSSLTRSAFYDPFAIGDVFQSYCNDSQRVAP
jgi:hypothetical protein